MTIDEIITKKGAAFPFFVLHGSWGNALALVRRKPKNGIYLTDLYSCPTIGNIKERPDLKDYLIELHGLDYVREMEIDAQKSGFIYVHLTPEQINRYMWQ